MKALGQDLAVVARHLDYVYGQGKPKLETADSERLVTDGSKRISSTTVAVSKTLAREGPSELAVQSDDSSGRCRPHVELQAFPKYAHDDQIRAPLHAGARFRLECRVVELKQKSQRKPRVHVTVSLRRPRSNIAGRPVN